MAEYRTIKQRGSDEFVEKKSRFIGYIAPVETEDEAIAFINEIRAKHRDATHNVYAYSLRAGQIKRASDDGEPSGTGGVPMLNVLNGNGLVDVCCVVTRYFGGTLLGVGGLVRAYTEGAKIAVAAGKIKTMAESADVMLTCDYNLYGKIEHFINEHKILVVESDFGAEVSLVVRLRAEDVEGFEHDMVELTSARVSTEVISRGWNEM
ncbi:MAG: YigZ family protein [Oscillospiraceae bacterium]|nr:YigZ family protein [Oscillospiraceae bacterium]